jgi:hypothetical protein
MARTTGPLLSLDASGTIAGTLVFSKWKGRNYVRQLVQPDNPKSAKQTGVRAMMKYLAQLWTSISAPNKATWTDLALARQISPFNAYLAHNLTRWQTNKGPTKAYPAAQTDAPGSMDGTTPAGNAGYAELTITRPAAAKRIGIIIYRDTKEITTPNWANAIAVQPASPAAGDEIYTDSPLEPGIYHYRAAGFTADGRIGTACTDEGTDPPVT